MKYIVVIVLVVCVYSCKKNNKENEFTKTYVQKEEIQLVNPKIIVNNVIIDTSSSIIASLPLDQTVIRYTTDGNEPTETSEKYTDIISISESGTYTFKAFHPEFKSSGSEQVSFFKKGIDVDIFSLITPLNKQYPGQGESTLVNHKKGTLNFRDGEWIGVTEPFIAIIDFKTKIFLDSVDIGYLVNTDAWIFPIQNVSIAFSENGADFTDIEPQETLEKLKTGSTKLDNVHIPVAKKLKKLKIKISNVTSIPEWHQGKGNPAWLFMDEWIFNAKISN
ncbi:chitobiase/beta-hexosaminidase C-terminal domain-containing protein [Aquimarina algiphila]|uniref:chitobiase/beta-hexosaminidase C-terminal domain-containing protein n=1 Tax=Aquimarina algiphila TaxID=2047982 RepID=UPI002490D0C1|nr:chitobiase/beta-hexosaminidase C-terminal domain-containing protein [Aquimarina algiphila]